MKQLYFLIAWFFAIHIHAQTLNAYAKVTSVTGSNVLALSNVNIANHTFTVGGQVVIMQMQDDVIGTNTTNAASFGGLSAIANAGNYEIRTITAVNPASGTPTSVTITPALANTYNTGANSSVQMISFRDMGLNYTTSANITGLAWDGNVGGVIAFYVTNTLTLNHSVIADVLGFRGGQYSIDYGGPQCSSTGNSLYITNSNQEGFKGEGIYRNTNTNFTNARGRMLNGGGGGADHNAGGGGGGNYSAGGQGGNGYNNCTTFPAGGLGGLSLSGNITASRVFMGGGGGGGQQNNSQNSSGGRGGGIILIKANTIATSTTCGSPVMLSANGATATSGGNDGMGGGGAGGSIILEANVFAATSTCTLLVRSNGGAGGNCNDAAAHAGGGGGGQGVVIYSIAQPTTNMTTQTTNGAAGRDNSGGSVSAGTGGGTSGTGIIGSSSGPLPVELTNFTAELQGSRVYLQWATATELNNDHFTVERSTDGFRYTPITQVKGAGNSRVYRNYSAYDNDPAPGTAYYRLKQTDFNTQSNYSPLVSVHYQTSAGFSFFPNPIKRDQNLYLEFDRNTGASEVIVSIFDLTGKALWSEEIIFESESKTGIALGDMHLEEGIYFLKVQNGSASQVKKLLIR